MRRIFALPTFAAIMLVVACGGDADDTQSAVDSLEAADSMDLPRNPKVISIDMGMAADSAGRITGGSQESFSAADTLFVSVRTQYVPEHAPIMVRLSQGSSPLDSMGIMAGAPDDASMGRSLAVFPRAASLANGTYLVEVLLEGVSQGIREVRFGNP